MLGTKFQQCCGCLSLKPSKRLFHQSLVKLNEIESQQKIYTSEENLCWARQRSSPRLVLENKSKPYVKGPHDVLIKVKAASVNPMDVAMTGWYGDNILTFYEQAKRIQQVGPSALCNARFLQSKSGDSVTILGRDFSGSVEAVGHMVHKFKPGDEVYGATYPIVEGSHAFYTMATQDDICKKPSNLTHIEAASLPYAALTFLSGLQTTSLCSGSIKDKRVHLNAGAGGIGTFAIQYLKAIGCEVTVSVSTSAREVVDSLQPDHVLDYQSPTYKQELRQLAGFDVAFDFAGDDSALSCVKPQGWYVTAVSPLLSSTDDKGLVLGGAQAAVNYGQKLSQALLNHGVYYTWAYFSPNSSALADIKALTEDNKIKPIIEQVFPFTETPAAYEKVGKGKGRGKVVIDMTGS